MENNIYNTYQTLPIKTDIKTNQKYLKDIESFINNKFIYDYCKELNLIDSLASELSNIRNISYNTTPSDSKSTNTSSVLAYILVGMCNITGLSYFCFFIVFSYI